MSASQLTPPSNQDGKFGWEPDTGQFEPGDSGRRTMDDDTARKLARDCFESSSNWLNAGRRAAWTNSLRAYQSRHASGSKYLSSEYAHRSRLYRPKTRAMVRKAEAQTAAAFFSNEDVISITAQDDDDPVQQASAEVLKELVQYRLTKTVPWFLTLIGARQDAEVLGICVAKVWWKYEERRTGTETVSSVHPETGEVEEEDVETWEKVTDDPVIDLIAPENIRFEPGADWRQAITSSPYVIELVPMYITDVRRKMAPGPRGEEAEWFRVSDSSLRSATDLEDDVTRRAREQGRVPGKDHDAWKPRDYDICWVHNNIIRWEGEDWQYYTVGLQASLLSEPRPLREVFLHGERPYIAGFVMLETHKTYPAGKVELVRDLQQAANDDWNLRFDAVKLSLNPRQFVRAGAAVELNDLKTFAPGKITLMNSKANEPLTNNVIWDRPPPPDASSYEEQDRINLDFDELVGDFSNSSVQSSLLQQQSATGMHLMSGQASGMNEYELRVFAESFVEPLLRLFIKVEQAYETDPTILALAGKKAGLFEKFGISEITDELLSHAVTTKVNVGIGATNPQMKLRNFATGARILGEIFGPIAAQGANWEEVAKEVFGLCGYKDGERFVVPDFDPRVTQLQQQLQKAQQKAPPHAASAQQSDPMRLQATQIQTQGRLAEQRLKTQGDMHMAQIDYNKAMEAERAENWRTLLKAHLDQQNALAAHQHQQSMQSMLPQPRVSR